jgi:hypothetical protein
LRLDLLKVRECVLNFELAVTNVLRRADICGGIARDHNDLGAVASASNDAGILFDRGRRLLLRRRWRWRWRMLRLLLLRRNR